VDQVRAYLIGASALPEDRLPTYGDVAALYGGIARGVAPVLNSIARDCEAAGEPDLTALVVDRDSRRPRSFEGRPVEPGTHVEVRWRQELARLRKHVWS
jgi:hypothetical protein